MKNNGINLYTYANSWKHEIHSRTLWATIRRTYILKSVALLLVLPMDLLVIVFIILSGRRFSLFVATEKWPSLTEDASDVVSTASISPPTYIFRKFKSRAKYIPASVFYLPAAFGIMLPNSLRHSWSSVAIFVAAKILGRLITKSATLVVHSDALPFGRVLVMAANSIQIKTVCIQHGNFREINVITEQDGFLCAHNIVRSSEDGGIVRRASSETKIHVIPEFFKIHIINSESKSVFPRILLLGEGYHIIDVDFNRVYLNHLVLMQSDLIKFGADVVFRPHPSERKMMWSNRFRKIDIAPLEFSLASVDVVIGYSSTLLQESAEIGIPAFYLDPFNNGHRVEGRNGVRICKYINPGQVMEAGFNAVRQGNKTCEKLKIAEFSRRDLLNILLQ